MIVADSSPNTEPLASLFDTQPLASLDHLKATLLPALIQENNNGPTRIFHILIAHIRSDIQRFRDIKQPPLFDRIHFFGPGSPEFSPPFTSALHPSESTLKALSKQIGSVQILEVDLAPPKALNLLGSLPHSLSTLTTLLLRVRNWENRDDSLVRAIPSMLGKHHNIICLSFERGKPRIEPSLIKQFNEATAHNCQRWKSEAQKRNIFSYTVGVQARPSKKRFTKKDFRIHHHAILLTKRTETFALVYVPEHGGVIPTLALRVHRSKITLIAKLVRSGEGDSSDTSSNTPPVSRRVPISADIQHVSFREFSEVSPGCYQFQIELSKGCDYFFEKLTFEFSPSAGHPLDGTSIQSIPAAMDDWSRTGQGSLVKGSLEDESDSESSGSSDSD
ncbi:hypothetical protein V5O48_019238 [Marasmius crinis-equi]|uniref:Uncharacterized protein n=1 Tax=Marasmius crinis-equi TaxID=585013 RepID=A0ABR3EJ08_9AGAR